VDVGPDAPRVLTAYVEIVPTDAVKYELDKDSGILKIDRPQQFSNVCPALYGFVPRTLCDAEVGRFCEERTGRTGIVGDGDPMDICVLTERPITHGDILVRVRPIGGLRMIDGDEADDKIIAVMENDAVFGAMQDISECPAGMLDRLRHYFLTYKQLPDGTRRRVEITHVYGLADAHEVIRRSRLDYDRRFTPPAAPA
jgi:inorganic pyrophosphatase